MRTESDIGLQKEVLPVAERYPFPDEKSRSFPAVAGLPLFLRTSRRFSCEEPGRWDDVRRVGNHLHRSNARGMRPARPSPDDDHLDPGSGIDERFDRFHASESLCCALARRLLWKPCPCPGRSTHLSLPHLELRFEVDIAPLGSRRALYGNREAGIGYLIHAATVSVSHHAAEHILSGHEV